MSLATDGSPYPVLLPASKIIKYSKLPDCKYTLGIQLSERTASLWTNANWGILKSQRSMLLHLSGSRNALATVDLCSVRWAMVQVKALDSILGPASIV